MTLSIGEGELPAIAGPEMDGPSGLPGAICTRSTRRENRDFLHAWRRFTGAPNAVTNDPMEATWIGFNLWTAAVEPKARSTCDKVRRALAGRRIDAPSGFEVKMDLANHHLHKPAMIGRITKDGRIVPVSVTDGLVAPEPWSPWIARREISPHRSGLAASLATEPADRPPPGPRGGTHPYQTEPRQTGWNPSKNSDRPPARKGRPRGEGCHEL